MSDSIAPPPFEPGALAHPYLVEPGPGRLLLLRVYRLDSVELTRQFFREIRVATQSLGDRVVVCADYRPVVIFSPDVAEEMARQITDTNPRIERSVALSARSHATQSLQSSRIVKTAGLVDRRQFSDGEMAIRWLGEVLNPDELARLRAFVAEYPGEGTSSAPR
jgi:hypothetical protein